MRDDGFYWILFQREWQVAAWSQNWGWQLIGLDGQVGESSIEEIDERRVYRNPPENCIAKCSCGRELHQHAYCQICDNDE
jgi:hypothetical protein